MNECRFENKRMPKLLDIIEVSSKKSHPNCFQCENYTIDDGYYWTKEGDYDSAHLVNIIDTPDSLWEPDCSSTYGVKDRVEGCNMDELEDSLYLITPTSLEIIVQTEGFEYPKPKVRAYFKYNEKTYLFSVTDRSIENSYKAKGIGAYPFENTENRIFMCVSIGLPWNNYCYKFVASIIAI